MNKTTVEDSLSSLQARHDRTLVELELYKLLVDNVHDSAVFFMDTDGYVRTWNKGAQKNKGYAASEIIGKHFSIFYLQKDKDDGKPERELELARKYGRIEDEGWRLKKDGCRFWANVVVTALYDTDGKLIGFAKVTRDMTQHKEQQHDLQLLNASKDEFISLASHQLRTPATGVKQYVGMLIEGFTGTLKPNQQELLEKAYESNERQLRIISDLLKVAQVDAGKVKPLKNTTEMHGLITSIINEQHDTFSRRYQTISYKKPTPTITAWIDSDLIRMVIENIINNASKYSHDNKAIVVTLGETKESVIIDVKDEGVGIAELDIPRLFEKFARIDNDLSAHVGGTGLGLYWAKKIIDLHDGAITMASNPGKGTTFSITLPK